MMSSSSPPIPHYIGITGVQKVSEVERLASMANAMGLGHWSAHTLMLGVLVSSSTIDNRPPACTSKPYRHIATREELRDVLLAANSENILGMVHFELHKSWPGTLGDSSDVISLLHFLANDGLRPPVQLNGVLLPAELRQIHQETGVAVVLQLRKELSELGIDEVLSYIDSVGEAISTILMDPSAGTGEMIAFDRAIGLYREIVQRFPGRFTFGFAGGLGGAKIEERERTTALARALLAHFPSGDFSLDSETKVRTPAPTGVGDVIDIDLSEAYLSAVRAAF